MIDKLVVLRGRWLIGGRQMVLLFIVFFVNPIGASDEGYGIAKGARCEVPSPYFLAKRLHAKQVNVN